MNKIVGLEQIHRHSFYSLLDGYANVEEYGEYSKTVNQKFLSITDHGMMSAVPQQIRTAEKYGLEPIFGCELYINPEQPKVPSGQKTTDYIAGYDPETKLRLKKSYHLLAIAASDKGYSNLVNLSSWAWKHGFYYKPRINLEILKELHEGIIFTSCCYNSEVGQAFDKGGAEAADEVIKRYVSIVGKENYYLEIMLLDFHKQKPYNQYIISAAQRFDLPIIVTQDCHYCKKEDAEMQRKMLMIQTKNTMADIAKAQEAAGELADMFEMQDSNLWMKSEEELNEKWEKDYKDTIDYEILEIAKMNTVKLCERAKGVKLDRTIKLPIFDNENEVLYEKLIEGFKRRKLPKTRQYTSRLKEEFELIQEKEFSSYFLIQQKMTDEARRYWSQLHGGTGHDAVGPARGSGAGSLALYCLGVTDVNPIKHDLLFSRFLSPARGGKSVKLRFSQKPIIN